MKPTNDTAHLIGKHDKSRITEPQVLRRGSETPAIESRGTLSYSFDRPNPRQALGSGNPIARSIC